ncbi:hypothetical protein [Variovorax arabinosiphilus]|uniref:hypothetical protein n=1 Tax=Variovorax arabinosiphilus TaxID=3053498 RepID=UPI002576147E|nr:MULTISPECIES: hypothetical protein [unclassified Variovorax]MDM0118433.1 hypothetical protein [Variovorax sp. J2L1-78]MDM0128858.1 hypothetical protein [Variovorax sp. J2L1-63]MDM0233356.1 hypothetical protein [Variovorax sp. J2R1-6]
MQVENLSGTLLDYWTARAMDLDIHPAFAVVVRLGQLAPPLAVRDKGSLDEYSVFSPSSAPDDFAKVVVDVEFTVRHEESPFLGDFVMAAVEHVPGTPLPKGGGWYCSSDFFEAALRALVSYRLGHEVSDIVT